jgi:hypothetical protein
MADQADKKIKDLTAITTADNADEIVIDHVANPDGSKTKKITKTNFLKEVVLSISNVITSLGNYFTKTESDNRYLQSFTETDPVFNNWASSNPLPTGNHLIYVSKDPSATDIRTGISKYNPNKPYVTLTKAQEDAVSGDTIVVLPGTYTNIDGDTTNANLGKDGVNWYFYNGAKIDLTGDIFDGDGRWIFTTSDSSFSVDGFGEFYNTNTNANGIAHGLSTGGTGEIYFRAKKVIVNCVSGLGYTFQSANGSKQYLYVDEAVGNGSVAIAFAGGYQEGWIGRATAGGDTFWATGDSEHEDSAIQILSADYVYGGAVATDNDNGGTQYFNIGRIAGGALRASSPNVLSKVYATVGNIIGATITDPVDIDSGWAIDCVLNSKMIVKITGEAIGYSAVQAWGGTLILKGIFKSVGTNQPAITVNRVNFDESLIYTNLVLDDVTLIPNGTGKSIDVINGDDPDIRDVTIYSAFSTVGVSDQINEVISKVIIDGNRTILGNLTATSIVETTPTLVKLNQTKTLMIDGDFYGMYLKSPVKKITIPDLGFGYTITRVTVQSSVADPTTEFAGDLKWCDEQGTGAFPSTNPTVIKVLDTTTGNYDSGAITEDVATGKELYISMDSNVDYGVMWTIKVMFNLKTS